MRRLQSGLIPSPQYHTEDWEQDELQSHTTRKYIHVHVWLWAITTLSLFTLQSQYLTWTSTSTSFSWRLHRTPAFWLPLLPFAVPLHLGQEAVRVREGTSTSGNDWVKEKGSERRREREQKWATCRKNSAQEFSWSGEWLSVSIQKFTTHLLLWWSSSTVAD